jgi:hypothetical protein
VASNSAGETKLMVISFYIVDLLDRGFDGFADRSQFLVDTFNFGTFLGTFCTP